MIQDIRPYVYHNEWKNVTPLAEDVILLYKKDGVLMLRDEKGEISFPRRKQFEDGVLTYTYLFSIDEERFFLGTPVGEEDAFHGAYLENFRRDASLTSDEDWEKTYGTGGTYEHVSRFRTASPRHLAFAGITGHQLYLWYRSRRFCGRCGKPMIHSEKERMMRCEHCGSMVYPQISPAVIVAVVHKGKLLMTKYAGRGITTYALVAGFTEIGETVEETVHREVMEEVGLPVKNLSYYKSQPWSFSGSMLFGFFCELDGEDDEITLDRSELAEGGFFTPEEVPEDVEGVALTREMMVQFKTGAYKKYMRTEDGYKDR